MDMLTRGELDEACRIIYEAMPATPQYTWPLLAKAVGAEVWVKHENHTPTGAFKVRGGLTFMDWLRKDQPQVHGVITATRGNHGQSQAFAARRHGLNATVLVPEGNSVEKNAAMEAFGAKLIESGADFDAARQEAERLSQEKGLFMVPSFHQALVRGVATYAYELLQAVPDLDVIYVPIGCGSGICGTILAREALGLKTEIVGVVSENALTAKLSRDAGKPIATNSARTFADGMAVRMPVAEALEIYGPGVADIVSVSDMEIAEAIRLLYQASHQLAEGAGAASLAGVMKDRAKWQGCKVGVILSGQNIDADCFAHILTGKVPEVR